MRKKHSIGYLLFKYNFSCYIFFRRKRMKFVWLILAILLMIGEIYTPGFFLFCISLSSLTAAIAAFVTESITIQVSVFVVALFLSVLLLRPVLNKFFAKEKKTNTDRMIGMSVVVEERISKGEKGRVKVNGESWFAISDETLEIGDKAMIDQIEGLTVKVHKDI